MKKLLSILLIILIAGCKKSYYVVPDEDSPNAKAAKALLATTQPPLHISGKAYFFGDSITEGYDGKIVNPRNWVGLVSAFTGWDGFNYGIGGTTLEKYVNGVSAAQSMVNRVGEIPTKTDNDKYLFFAYGVNDVYLNTADLNPTQFSADYQLVLDNAYSKGWLPKDIVLVNIYYLNEATLLQFTDPAGTATGRLAAFNTALKAVADKNTVHFIDIRTFMLNHGADYLLGDGVHPNETGYAVIARGIEDALRVF
jgi:lysophospholipase L1-like esterase